MTSVAQTHPGGEGNGEVSLSGASFSAPPLPLANSYNFADSYSRCVPSIEKNQRCVQQAPNQAMWHATSI